MGKAALEQDIEGALSLGSQLVAEALVEVSTVSVKGVGEEELRLQSGLFAAGLDEGSRAAAEGFADGGHVITRVRPSTGLPAGRQAQDERKGAAHDSTGLSAGRQARPAVPLHILSPAPVLAFEEPP